MPEVGDRTDLLSSLLLGEVPNSLCGRNEDLLTQGLRFMEEGKEQTQEQLDAFAEVERRWLSGTLTPGLDSLEDVRACLK